MILYYFLGSRELYELSLRRCAEMLFVLYACHMYDDYDDTGPYICTIILGWRYMGGPIPFYFLGKSLHTGVY